MFHVFDQSDEAILASLLNSSSKGNLFQPHEIEILSVSGLPNTSDAEVRFKHTTSLYTGETSIQLTRHPIALFLREKDRDLYAPTGNTIHDMLQYINEKYQIRLKPSDVYDGPLPPDRRGSVRVQITPHCLFWVGYVDFNLVHPNIELTAVIRPGTKIDFKIPGTEDMDKILAEAALRPIDARVYGKTLVGYRCGDLIGVDGCLSLGIASDSREDSWDTYIERAENNNLYRARVIYNGPNQWEYAGRDRIASIFTDVLVLELSDWCRNYTGVLVLGYDTHHPVMND